MIEGKLIRRKQLEEMLEVLATCLSVGPVRDALKATKDQDTCKAVIAKARFHDTLLIDWALRHW